jgi:hypothetical protein
MWNGGRSRLFGGILSDFRRVNSHRSIDRVLLTEVAPFELPPNVINTSYFVHVLGSELRLEGSKLSWKDRGRLSDSYLALLIAGDYKFAAISSPTDGRLVLDLGKTPWKLPYRFWVRKNDGQKRTLSLPHPLTQLGVVSFYREYAEVLAFHTSRSKYSLRHPDSISRFSFVEDKTHSYERKHRREGIEVAGTELEAMGSFFRYRQYSNINKFYESRQFHELEARFPFQRRLDITRCFESLYTHSVDWAVRGHHASKHGIGEDIFSTKLDKLFQGANNGQTNGVIVGPEFSRIFAEVILQCVDMEVQSDLAARRYVFDREYWIGRYVDDYFIFCANDREASLIQDVIETQLEKYNLRLNKSKQIDFNGPSYSPIHTAKQRIARQISRYYRESSRSIGEAKSARKSPDIDSVISNYKALLHDLSAKPAEVNNFILGVIEKRVTRMSREATTLTRPDRERIAKVMRDTSVLVEFLYASSASVPSALRASRIMLHTIQLAKALNLDRDLMLSVTAEIDRAVLATIGRHNLEEPDLAGAERFYWLLLHAELGRPWLMPESDLRHFIERTKTHGSDYLLIVTALQYMQTRRRYAALRAELLDRVSSVVDSLRPQTAERAMLQADMLACPYIDDALKQKWMTIWFSDRSPSDNADALKDWPPSVFAAWSAFDLGRALKAKKSRDVY